MEHRIELTHHAFNEKSYLSLQSTAFTKAESHPEFPSAFLKATATTSSTWSRLLKFIFGFLRLLQFLGCLTVGTLRFRAKLFAGRPVAAASGCCKLTVKHARQKLHRKPNKFSLGHLPSSKIKSARSIPAGETLRALQYAELENKLSVTLYCMYCMYLLRLRLCSCPNSSLPGKLNVCDQTCPTKQHYIKKIKQFLHFFEKQEILRP